MYQKIMIVSGIIGVFTMIKKRYSSIREMIFTGFLSAGMGAFIGYVSFHFELNDYVRMAICGLGGMFGVEIHACISELLKRVPDVFEKRCGK